MSSNFYTGMTSSHADIYAKFRPTPPQALTDEILKFLKVKVSDLNLAVDVGCGPGTSTTMLAPYFEVVHGYDISEAQINKARTLKLGNVSFSVSPAEKINEKDESVQLVMVMQAVHYFDLDAFYKEVTRVLVPNGVLALCSYLIPKLGKTAAATSSGSHHHKNRLRSWLPRQNRKKLSPNFKVCLRGIFSNLTSIFHQYGRQLARQCFCFYRLLLEVKLICRPSLHVVHVICNCSDLAVLDTLYPNMVFESWRDVSVEVVDDCSNWFPVVLQYTHVNFILYYIVHHLLVLADRLRNEVTAQCQHTMRH